MSLLQTLLFKAETMTLIANLTGSEAKNLLRFIKLMGLMYMAEKEDGLIKLHIDGPASTLISTRRYGTRMAKLIPLILRLRTWRIRASIYHMKKHYTMEIDERYGNLMPAHPPIEESFDSWIEEDFMLKFKALGMGWNIIREPEPLVANGTILIPDFALVKGNVKVYLEIMGFWTSDYLERKLKKLELIEEPIIIAVNRSLACTKKIEEVLSKMPKSKLIIFDGKLKSSDIVPILREFEQRIEVKEGPKQQVQVDEKAVASYLSKIVEEPLQKVLEDLKAFGVQDFQEAYRLLRRHGLIVMWRGLDQSKAVVKRMY